MNRLMILLLGAVLFFLTACETTREISLNDDGSGTMVTTTDLSAMIAMAKMSAPSNELEKANKPLDTTISLDKVVDSIAELSPEERDLARKGSLQLSMNMEEATMFTKVLFPFSKMGEISGLDQLSGKVMQEAMKNQMKNDSAAEMPMGEMPSASTDSYFTMTYKKGLIEKKLMAEKYADIDSDEGMVALKGMVSDEMPMSSTLIFNLPKPARKTSGKNLTISEDKKKVTIVTSMHDFFEDASKLEFRIEY